MSLTTGALVPLSYAALVTTGGMTLSVVELTERHLLHALAQWNYMTTQKHGVTLQNFGTVGFAAVDVNRAITNIIAPQWNMIRSGLYKYAFQ